MKSVLSERQKVTGIVRAVSLGSLLFFPATGEACSLCLSSGGEDPTAGALRASLLCLLAVTALTLALFAKFFWNIHKRERLLTKKREGNAL